MTPRRRWYRPKRKEDLIRHLEEHHKPWHPEFSRRGWWTVASLTEAHDAVHEGRYVEAAS